MGKLLNLHQRPHLIYWGAWGLAGTYNFCRDVVGSDAYVLFIFNAAHFMVWGLLGYLIMPMARRFPLGLKWQAWLFHLLFGAMMTQIDITLGHVIYMWIRGTLGHKSFLDIAIGAYKNCFHLGLLTYWGFVGVIQASDAQKLAKARAVQIAEHQTLMVRAELKNLKSQLQPHFLFNTLHSISAVMHYDLATADRMLNRLSELLRLSLKEKGGELVSLRQEIAFSQAYLEIEKIRFEHRLEVNWAIPEALYETEIPPFILQPIIENAIKYGVAPHAAGGKITIRAYSENAQLLLEIENQSSESVGQKEGFGIGLNNIRERLEIFYGLAQGFELMRRGLETVARIQVPLRLSAS